MKTSNALLWVSLAILVVVGGVFLIMNNGNSKTIGQAVNTQSSQNLIDIQSPIETSLPSTNTPKPTIPSEKTHEVIMKGLAFSPAKLTINVGDTVKWTNLDSIVHSVVSDTGEEMNSLTLGEKQSYSHTFTTQGTYPYHCFINQYMKGTIVVVHP